MIPTPPSSTWSVSDAKNHLSTVLARAHAYGPQLITNRGVPDSYISAVSDFNSVQAREILRPKKTLLAWLAEGREAMLAEGELDLERSGGDLRELPDFGNE